MPSTTHTRDYVPRSGAFPEEMRAALLAPLAGERPTGEYLRYEGTYDRIAEARREDDARLGQGVWQKEAKRADWAAVAQICGEALEWRSKDLQIAAWLMEAWCKLGGFAGAAEGLRLLADLCAAYWDDLYPSRDDLEYRAAPFHWIDEKLSVQLKFIPLSEPSDLAPAAFTFADWEMAGRAEQRQLQSGASKNAEVVLVPAQIQAAVQRSSPGFLADSQAQLAAARTAAAAMEAFLDAHFTQPGPSLRLFRDTLENIQQFLSLVPASLPASVTASLPAANLETMAAPAAGSAGSAAAAGPEASGPIQSRQEAYRRLAEAAAYLLRTEPHSPAPYLVNRAIRWGQLPLDQLLPEMVRNDSALGELRQLLNLNRE